MDGLNISETVKQNLETKYRFNFLRLLNVVIFLIIKLRKAWHIFGVARNFLNPFLN